MQRLARRRPAAISLPRRRTSTLEGALASLGIALVTSLLAPSCASDESPPPPARMGAAPVPVAGAKPAAQVATDDDDGGAGRDAGRREAAAKTAFIYNQVLAKLKDPAAFDRSRLHSAIEKRTGAEVKEIKKGPMGLLSIVFDDVTPPRGEAEQRALVEKLKGMQELQYAEPERLLQAR